MVYVRRVIATLLIELEQFIHPRFVVSTARGQSLPHEIRLLTNQFNIEHRRIIGADQFAASLAAYAELGFATTSQGAV